MDLEAPRVRGFFCAPSTNDSKMEKTIWSSNAQHIPDGYAVVIALTAN
jgi:hypothetical protein